MIILGRKELMNVVGSCERCSVSGSPSKICACVSAACRKIQDALWRDAELFEERGGDLPFPKI